MMFPLEGDMQLRRAYDDYQHWSNRASGYALFTNLVELFGRLEEFGRIAAPGCCLCYTRDESCSGISDYPIQKDRRNITLASSSTVDLLGDTGLWGLRLVSCCMCDHSLL